MRYLTTTGTATHRRTRPARRHAAFRTYAAAVTAAAAILTSSAHADEAAPRLRVIVPTAFAYSVHDIVRSFTARTGIPVAVHVATAGNIPANVRDNAHDAPKSDGVKQMVANTGAAASSAEVTAQAASAGKARHNGSVRKGAPTPYDVVIASAADTTQMTGQGLLAADSRTMLPKIGIGMAVPKGHAIPDIHDVNALRDALLSAHTVVFEDPAMGGPSGANVVKLFDRLGIADQMKSRSRMIPPDDIRHALTHSGADLAIEEARLLRDAPDMQYVGDLPGTVQYFTRYAAAVTTRSPHKTEARALLSFIASGLSPHVQVDP